MSRGFSLTRTHRKHQARIVRLEPIRLRTRSNNRDNPYANASRSAHRWAQCGGADTTNLLRETSKISAREITAEGNKSIYLARPFDHNNHGD